ncbi:MAG: hypothetical protein ACFFF9_11275 [Candidatus Thorarchaeota archaeon]
MDEVRRNSGDFNFITVKLKGLPKNSQIKSLESEWINPYELELLVECEGLVDASIGKEFTLDIDVSQLRGVRLPSGVAEDSQLTRSIRAIEEEHEEEVLSLPEGEWVLSSRFKAGEILWTLISPQTNQSWMGKTFSTKLNGSLNLKEMIEELVGDLENVSASRNNIANYDAELSSIRKGLRDYGWGNEKPQCRADATQIGALLKISLSSIGENEVVIFEEEFTPSDDDAESVIDALDEFTLSEYTIENKEEFRMMLREIFDDDEQEINSVDREEAELLADIEEYQEAGKLRAVCSHTNHLVEHYVRHNRFDVALEKAEGNISLLMNMDLEDEDVKWYLFIARVLKAEVLMSHGDSEGSNKEIEQAFEIIPGDIELWKLGGGVRREYYERCMKLRTIENSE